MAVYNHNNTTRVEIPAFPVKIKAGDSTLSLGSCFSTEIGSRLAGMGLDICNNPFGVLYNPVSIARSLKFLAQGHTFTAEDVIPRDTNPVRKENRARKDVSPEHRPIAPEGGGYVSFYHHGSFARKSPEEFLEHANASIRNASSWFHDAGWIIITFGTAWVYRHLQRDIIVSNCHKHPVWEFQRELLDLTEIQDTWSAIVRSFPDKNFIFTVSPIRHKKDGMHGNQVSKAILLLAVGHIVSECPNAMYFPAYEIMLDELRDYSWYAPDLVHPSPEAVEYVFRCFQTAALQ